LKIKLGEINIILDNLNKLIDKEINIKTSYKLSKLLKHLVNEYNVFDENRIKLINKYAEKDENNEVRINKENNSIIITDNNKDKFNKEINELVNIEIEIFIEKIRLDDLGEIMVSPRDLFNLDFLFEENI